MGKLPKLWCFKDVEKFNFLFFYFWIDLLFCKLLWSGFGQLVSVMERDPDYSMDTFYKQCESRFWWRIDAELLKERRDVEKIKLYEVD